MHFFLSILLFTAWKTAHWFGLQYGIQFFHLRSQPFILPAYILLSVFQLIYLLWNLLITIRKKKSQLLLYLPFTVVIMETAILLSTFGFLFSLENSPLRLTLILSFLLPISAYYFLFQQYLNRLLLKKEEINIPIPPKSPLLIPLFYNLIIPTLLSTILFALKADTAVRTLTILNLWITGNASIMGLLIVLDRLSLSTRTGRQIKNLSPFLLNPVIHPIAVNGIGWIQNELHNYELRKKLVYHDKTFLTQYLSEDIKKEILKKGIALKSQEVTAAVSTIRFEVHLHPTEESLLIEAPSDPLQVLDKIMQMVGNYSEQYGAYPIFSHNQIHLIFGAPVYFEHLNYHAIECSSQILHDLNQMHSEVVNIKKHCGIVHGTLYMGSLHSRGKDYTELQFTGSALLQSEQLANAAYQADITLLTNESCIKDLKTKFFIEKNYRIQLNDTEEIIASKIRI